MSTKDYLDDLSKHAGSKHVGYLGENWLKASVQIAVKRIDVLEYALGDLIERLEESGCHEDYLEEAKSILEERE